MIRIFFTVIFILHFLSICAQIQAPYVVKDKTIGGESSDYINCLISTGDNGFILAGKSTSNISGDKSENSKGVDDFWIVKLDSLLNVEWDKTIGGNDREQSDKIIQTDNNNYVLCGSSLSNSSGDKSEDSRGDWDFWMIKLDALGNIIWEKTIGGNDRDFFADMLKTIDGGYLLGGTSKSNESGEKTEDSKGVEDVWLIKVDSLGNIEWDKTIGGNDYDDLSQIQQTLDGGFILGCNSSSSISGDKSESSKGHNDYWIIKLDSKGNVIWDKTIGGNGGDYLRSLVQTSDNGYILYGSSGSPISGDKSDPPFFEDTDIWVVKIDSIGNVIWDKTYGVFGNTWPRSILKTMDGGFMLGGAIEEMVRNVDVWLIKLDSQGNMQWNNCLGGLMPEEWYGIYNILQDQNGNYLFGVASQSNIGGEKTEDSKGGADYWIVELSGFNYAPSIPDPNLHIPENTPTGITSYKIVGYDSDGDSLYFPSFYVKGGDPYGRIDITPDGSVNLLKELDFESMNNYQITIVISDGKHNSLENITVHIEDVDEIPPIAAPDEFYIDEDKTLTISSGNSILKNDTDAEGGMLSAILQTDVIHGNLELETDGTFTYTPFKDFFGTDSYSYIASDGIFQSESAIVTINVQPINDPPTDIQIAQIDENTPIGTVIPINIIDVDDSIFTHSLVVGTGDENNDSFIIENNELKTAIEIDYEAKNTYNLRIKSTDQGGLFLEKGLILQVNNINDITISDIEVSNTYCGDDEIGSISIEVDQYIEPLTFSWSSGDITQDIENKPAGSYEVSITDGAGYSMSQTLEIGVDPIYTDAAICYVSSDESDFTKNRIFINTGSNPYNIDKYLIYREGDVAGSYNLIGEVPENEYSYLDQSSDSRTRSYRYKVGIQDKCGDNSPRSSEHSTIHLSANMGINKEVNLSWTSYKGLSFGTYAIYRKRGKGEYEKIADISSNNNTYTDVDKGPESIFYYYVASLVDVNCSQATAGRTLDLVRIRSNIFEIDRESTPTGLEDQQVFSNKLYPNPANNTLILELDLEYVLTTKGINIINASGQRIMEIAPEIIIDYMEVDISSFPSGIYLMQLQYEQGTEILRFIKN